jgi:hypothetical protein
LTSAGSGAAPTWATPGGGGALVYLSTVSASGAATADITTGFSATYDDYLIIGSGIFCSLNGISLYCQIRIGGVWYTTNTYKYHVNKSTVSSATYAANVATADTKLIFGDSSLSNSVDSSSTLNLWAMDVNDTTVNKALFGNGVGGANNSVTAANCFITGTTGGALDGIRFYSASGTITGTFKLYGIAKS